MKDKDLDELKKEVSMVRSYYIVSCIFVHEKREKVCEPAGMRV